MTCTICHHPANQHWHGQPICTPCRNDQRTVDRRLNWVLLGLAVVFVACMINISH